MDIIESQRESHAQNISELKDTPFLQKYNSQGFNSQNLADYTQIQTPYKNLVSSTQMSRASLSNRHLTDKDEMSVRVGVIGWGRWGAIHLRTLADLRSSGKISEIHVCVHNS